MSWTTDTQHTSFEFAVRHMVISTVKGRFGSSPSRPTSTRATSPARPARPSSRRAVSTRASRADTHLKSADFFDAEKYPR